MKSDNKIGRNSPCPCGSGNKYKKCCFGHTQMPDSMRELQRKMISGELPVRAEITSKEGTSSSMIISNARIVKDGVETTLLDEEIVLSTNTAEGDKTSKASAKLSIPVNDQFKPEILTKGNASVTNATSIYDIEIQNKPKSLRIESKTGLFAVIRVQYQRDKGFNYFDVLFGTKGQSELINTKGQKERPHIAFFSEGNGKFIRLSGYDVELSSKTFDRARTPQPIPAASWLSVHDCRPVCPARKDSRDKRQITPRYIRARQIVFY